MAFFGKSDSELKVWEEELGKRENEFSLQSTKLKDKAERLEKEQKEVLEKSKELAEKESDLTKREVDAKNGFSEQHEKSFAENIRNQLEQLNQRRAELASLESSYSQHSEEVIGKESELLERERVIKEREIQADVGFASKNSIFLRELEKKENDIKLLEDAIAVKEQKILDRVKELDSRDTDLKDAERKRDTGYIDEKKEFLENLHIKENEFNIKLNKELEEKFENEKNEIVSQKAKLEEEQLKLEEFQDEIEYDKKRLNSKEDGLKKREENLSIEIENGVEERKKSFDSELESFKSEANRLRESLSSTQSILSTFNELKRKLGDEEPEKVLLKLTSNIEEIELLKKELMDRPTREMQETFDNLTYEKSRLENACASLSQENLSLKSSANDIAKLQLQIEDLEYQKNSFENRYESINADNNRLTEDLKRLQVSYERKADREERINDIRLPYFKTILECSKPEMNEVKWLENIRSSCEDYGLKFSKRMIYAFHTALKTSEWSPLTVLAGVSGTGKSELPRLYSHFGGINFLSLAVQPNWDSQESMLGFFNSIDNKFDAQPVLRLLAQSQEKKTKEYPEGLKDTMSLVLLDEMNLAYVELYFAEFLSKLELRRGKKGNDVPSLEIKLGAGVEPLNLPLGRNILWTGTMNQDETTKSLSDKVLDRGMVLHFPRPTTFERRRELKQLPDQSPLLSRKDWESWWVKKSKFTDKQIEPFKSLIEELNDYLATVGRALGHRVWQSMEYYMANHPDVQQALEDNDDGEISKSMKLAFEDQLVLKVMPKLRGIETRGRSKTSCLDKIRQLLDDANYSIVEDFDTACEAGYGQFMWNSAKYLEKEDNLNIFEDNKKKEIQKNNILDENHAKVIEPLEKGSMSYFTAEVKKGNLKKDNKIEIFRNNELIEQDVIKEIYINLDTTPEPANSVDFNSEMVAVMLENQSKVEKNDIIIIK